jgi:hypothetical protein
MLTNLFIFSLIHLECTVSIDTSTTYQVGSKGLISPYKRPRNQINQINVQMKCQTLSLFSLVHLLKLLTDTVNEKNSMQSMVKKLSMFNIKKKASNAKIRTRTSESVDCLHGREKSY